MTALRPPKGYKRGFSDEACRAMADRALASPLGQEALRQGWGHGLYQFVMDWGSTPSRPETKASLHRAANEFMWDLVDMRKIEKPDSLTAMLIKLYESRAALENELKQRFLRKET